MASAEREDLKAIWNCLSLSWRISWFYGSDVEFLKTSGEVAWQGLEQFLDLTGNEWPALYPGLHPAMLPEEVEAVAHAHAHVQQCSVHMLHDVLH